MVIIPNEKLHAEKMIEEGFLLTRKLSFELGILYRYYNSLGVEKQEIEQKLHDFCKFWLQNEYNYVKFIKIIEKISNFNKKTVLKQGNVIFFTKLEIRMLEGIENKKIRNLLFIMMFYGKVDGFGYCNEKESQLFKLAHIGSTKPDKRTEMIRWLYLNGYSKPTMTGGDKVLCIDGTICKDTPSFGKDVAFIIERYEDPLVYLKAHMEDGVIKVCEGCGVLIEAKSNSAKWCKKCREKRRLEGWRESKIRARSEEGIMG